jgi:murein DD-endopeptidase MepM/ murein hydrolase activator NlpD
MPVANDAVWLDVLPSMKGFGPALAKGADADAAKAGKSAGGKFGKAMLAGIAVVGAGAAVATKALYNIGKTFDEVSDTIRVGTGATGKALDSLNASARKVGTQVPANFKDVGTALADVNTRLGYTGKPLEDMTAQFLELSRITGTDVAANIKDVSRVFGDWGVESDKQSESLDYLFKVSQSTGIGVDQLSQKIVQFGAPMRQFGFSFEESAALMGKWEKEGVNTEAIMSGMKAGLGKLAKAGKDPAKAFEEISKQIKNAGSTGEATAIAIETFGQRAGPDLAAAVREGRFDLEELMGTLKGSSETIMSAGKETMSFSEQWQMFKNKVLVGLEPLATRVFAAVGKGMEEVSRGFTAFAAAWRYNDGEITSSGFPGFMERMGYIARQVFDFFKSDVLPRLKQLAAFIQGDVVPAVKSFGTWMQRNEKPIKIIAGVIGALLLPHLVKLAAQSVITRTKVVAAWAAKRAAAVRTAVVHVAQTALMVAKWAWLGVKAMFHAAKIAAAWLISMGPIGLVIAAVVGLTVVIVKNWDKIKDVIGRGWDWVKSKTVAFWERGIKPIFDKLTSTIRDTVPEAFRRGKELIGKAWDGIKALAAKPVNFVIETVYNNGIRAGFNKVADFLGMDTRLPAMKAIGGASAAPRAPRSPGLQAFGGVGDTLKGWAGKGWDWVKDKAFGGILGLLNGVGDSPWAQMVGGIGKKLLTAATDFATGKAASAPGRMGVAGRVLPRGSYQIGMPYLGYPGHYGADYPAPAGTPIFSLLGGVVSRALSLATSYGKHAFIDSPGGVQTRYAHMSNLMVSPGQTVLPGQQIGTVGTSGNSTGNHLHFEYLRNLMPINPASLGIFDTGGWLRPGMGGVNLTSQPEAVLTPNQWGTLSRLTASSALGVGGMSERMERTATAVEATPALLEEVRGLRSDVGHLARDFETMRRTR